MKIAIYARVSTDDKGQDPEMQVQKCMAYCQLHEHQIVAEFIDEGVSGDSFFYDRPEGKKLQELILSRKVEGVVVFSVDRFSRQNPMKILPLLNHLNEMGIRFISITEPVFNMESEFAAPMQYMLAWFSNYFLVQHKKKVNAGMEKAKRFGTKSGRAIGRQRKADYAKIRDLQAEGLNLSQIAKRTGYSKGSIFRALNVQKEVLLNTSE